jgi:hypothetical protein
MRYFMGFQAGVQEHREQPRIFLLAVSVAVNTPRGYRAAPLRSFRSRRCRVIPTRYRSRKTRGIVRRVAVARCPLRGYSPRSRCSASDHSSPSTAPDPSTTAPAWIVQMRLEPFFDVDASHYPCVPTTHFSCGANNRSLTTSHRARPQRRNATLPALTATDRLPVP